MRKRTHKPPSKVRYDESHPTVSIRVSRALYDQLDDLRNRSGKSLGDILREAVRRQGPSAHRSYMLGHEAAKKYYAVYYRCSVCRAPILIYTARAKAAVAQYMNEHGWAHSECHR